MADVPFTVDVFSEFNPPQVRIVWRDEPRPPHAGLDALVAETWARQMEQARRRGLLLFNGDLVRLLRQRIEGGTLVMEVGPTDYANWLGTNYLNPHRGDEFGWHLYSNPLGISATLISADGWLLFGRRNQRVACNPGEVHTFGGAIEAGERLDTGVFDAFASIRRELEEELGLVPGDFCGLVCGGVIRDRRIRQPEMLFEARISRTRAEIEARIDPARPDEEHDGVVACRDAPDAVLPFLRAVPRIAPIAVGAACLHGRRHFGEEWYARTLDALASCSLSWQAVGDVHVRGADDSGPMETRLPGRRDE